MKLNDVLSQLKALDFIDKDSGIVVCVCNGKSCKKEDQLFTCNMKVSEAEHFFGGLNVILNQIRAYGEDVNYMYSKFWFLLEYKKPDEE